MNEAREQILRSVRAALGSQSAAVPTTRPVPAAAVLDNVSVFVERVGETGADVHCVMGDVRTSISEVCRRHGASSLACPADLPERWLPADVRRIDDRSLAELDSADGAVTGCALAIADTGTVILDGGRTQGTRALTLVPDLHICVVFQSQLVAGVVEAIPRLATAVRSRGAPITFITGPSATSDIELSRIEGVHGPRRLVILLSADAA